MRSHHSRLWMCFDTHFRKLRGYCDKFAENVICVCPAYQITSHKSKTRERNDKLDMRMRQRAHEKRKTQHLLKYLWMWCCVLGTEFCELHVNFVFFVFDLNLFPRCVKSRARDQQQNSPLLNNLFSTFPCACRIFNYNGKTNFSKLYSHEAAAAYERSFLGHVWWRQWDLLGLAGIQIRELSAFDCQPLSLRVTLGPHFVPWISWPSNITEANTVRCLIEQGAINCPFLS